MELLLSKVVQLAVFVICAQTLLHFRAKESYEKYLKLLVSLMMLILLVEPLMGILGKDGKENFLENVRQYEMELKGIIQDRQLGNEEIVQILSNMTLKASKQVQLVESVEVKIADGTNQEKPGE